MTNKRLGRLLSQVGRRLKSVDPERQDLEDALKQAQQDLNTFNIAERKWRERWLKRAVPAARGMVLDWFIRECHKRGRTASWDHDLERYREYLSPKLPADLVQRALSALVAEGKLRAEPYHDTSEMVPGIYYSLPKKKK